ncbi:MAG TPA: hypothetical protein VM266_06450 [Solirubrobacteraceae bacterium]|nr:hypothetical protein [Solirubrobacteraceae bacterium]
MAKTVHIPWYATVFRADAFAEALQEIAPLALRFGARDYAVYRSREDEYKFLQVCGFEEKLDWERYWNGPEFIEWRGRYGGWYQVPVLYTWQDVLATGRSEVAQAGEVAAGS